jgi:hypothetical protein
VMVRHEPNQNKGHRSKRREPVDPSHSRRQPTLVVLWDEPPKGDAQEDSEDEQASHSCGTCASGTRMNDMSAPKAGDWKGEEDR